MTPEDQFSNTKHTRHSLKCMTSTDATILQAETTPHWENKENVCPVCPPPKKPRICVQLGWTITKLIHVLIHFQSHPEKPCSQSAHTNAAYKNHFNQILLPSASGTECSPSQYKSSTFTFFQHHCLTNTSTVSQRMCGPLELFRSIADCDQNPRSANLTNYDQSDSTHSFCLNLFQCLMQNYIGSQCSSPG